MWLNLIARLSTSDRQLESPIAQPLAFELGIDTNSKTLFDAAMELQASDILNARQAVPFFNVKDIEASLRFYVEGLAFKITRQWNPAGRIRWCWLERDGVAIMLQEYWKDGQPGGWPAGVLGQGVSICFVCADAIAVYHDSQARGLNPSRPFVGNNLWVTTLTDPDGYRLDFESPTDVPEETVYSGEPGVPGSSDTAKEAE